MKVFLISGIGADERMFAHIRLPAGFEPVHIPWITPLDGETLSAYARRLFLPYHLDQPFVLIGLSLGGIVSSEIAKIVSPVCTILLSSVPVASQLPPYYRLAAKLRAQRLVSPHLWKLLAGIKHALTIKGKDNKRLMRDMVRDSDPEFIRWGIDAVLHWDNKVLPVPLYHIHGKKDEVFPIRFARPTHVLPKGTHTAVFSEAKAINDILGTLLQKMI